MTGRRSDAEVALGNSRRIFEELVAEFSDIPAYCRHLFYSLANSPDSQLRDATRALELGHKCVERTPRSTSPWAYLGVAQYRCSQWVAAIDSLERSMQLGPNGYYTFEWLFLAMAHWHLAAC